MRPAHCTGFNRAVQSLVSPRGAVGHSDIQDIVQGSDQESEQDCGYLEARFRQLTRASRELGAVCSGHAHMAVCPGLQQLVELLSLVMKLTEMNHAVPSKPSPEGCKVQ